MSPQICGIGAINRAGFAGLHGGLPWGRNRTDLKFFKDVTQGETVVCGSTTYATLPNLPGRNILVLTRNPERFERRRTASPDGCFDAVVGSVEEAIAACPTRLLYVIGGAEVWKAFAPHYEEFLLNVVDDATRGDTRFPFSVLHGMTEVAARRLSEDCRHRHFARPPGCAPL